VSPLPGLARRWPPGTQGWRPGLASAAPSELKSEGRFQVFLVSIHSAKFERVGSSALSSALLSVSQGPGGGKASFVAGTDGNEGDEYGRPHGGTAAAAFQPREAYRTSLHSVIAKAAPPWLKHGVASMFMPEEAAFC